MECAWVFGPSFEDGYRMVLDAHDRAASGYQSAARCFAENTVENMIIDPFWVEIYLEDAAKERAAYAVRQRWQDMAQHRWMYASAAK